LPPRLAVLQSLTGAWELIDGEQFRFPDAGELAEVAALVGQGWFLLDGAPLYACLPAVWPRAQRCWVPDRLPKVRHQSDERRDWVLPWSPQDHDSADADLSALTTECGLPPAPPGRIWLLRSPWAPIATELVLHLIDLRCEDRGLMLVPADYTTAARELLGWDEEQIWAWWPGPSGVVARAWREQGRTGEAAVPVVLAGLGPAALNALERDGLSQAQAVAWAQVLQESGTDTGTGTDVLNQIRGWRALGLPADPPPHLGEVATDLTLAQAGVWITAGFDLAAVAKLMDIGVASSAHWRAAGLDAQQTREVWDADHTLTVAELRAFEAVGLDWQEQLAWIAHGFDADTANRWHRLEVTPMLARVWRSVGLRAEDALAHTDGAEEVGLPPGVQAGWFAYDEDPRQRHYSVNDPPGTRGRIAREHRSRRHDRTHGPDDDPGGP
jgi:hypothetical protein